MGCKNCLEMLVMFSHVAVTFKSETKYFFVPSMFFGNGRTEAAKDLAQTEAAGVAEDAGNPGRVAVVMDRTFFHLFNKI
jgi:hypothetical protein